MIDTTLSMQQAEDLFQREGILLGMEDAVPVFRIVELFGVYAGKWIEENIGSQPHHLTPGRDHNARGGCTEECPLIEYLYRPGFFKLVTAHNYSVLARRYKTSEGGRIWREIWQARCDRIAAEEERRREERRAKRAANRKKKQESEAPA